MQVAAAVLVVPPELADQEVAAPVAPEPRLLEQLEQLIEVVAVAADMTMEHQVLADQVWL
jgi:hypothetical protein